MSSKVKEAAYFKSQRHACIKSNEQVELLSLRKLNLLAKHTETLVKVRCSLRFANCMPQEERGGVVDLTI